ncbi:MAG: sigma-54-dependent Fis family transcriptional regulator [Desulfuromonadales bacterium]|nr:sigma-54-dependent Fis family transcriptional regulator [Desulfuromonadales bacterium]
MTIVLPLALVVDDEESIQSLLKTYLEREGFFVDCASDVVAAETFLSGKTYDLILVDICLGKGNGIELLRQIREHDQHVQVVLITGNPNVESAAEALRLGAFDYLIKPFTPYQIMGTARRALLSKRLVEEDRRKQANLDAIFRSASDSIILIDRDGCLVRANEAAMGSCGYVADHLGMAIRSIDTGCKKTCRDIMLSVLSDGMPRNFRRLECFRKNGVLRVFSLSTSPVIESDGRIDGAVAILRDETELVHLEKQVHRQSGFGGIVGRNSAMQRMYTLIEALANVQTTVLINGESGTGKELVADALHHQGVRYDKPFVKVNCSALSEHLLESELFGHVRGAYTGAMAARTGRFQLADGGTIFLDEIGDISSAMQMRLLRVLQEQEFEPVGASTPIKVDVRVVAATNQDLVEKVRLGIFRHDLYYRLNVVRLIIPPLRERRDDIPLLTEHFLNKFGIKFQRPFTGVSPQVMDLFMHHPWPGNVRELEHAIEHAAVLCPSGMISVEHLPQDFINEICDENPSEQPTPLPVSGMSLDEALKQAGGNKAKAARLLGVSRCTIYRWINENPDLKVTP